MGLREIQIWLHYIDLGLLHRSTQRIVDHRQLLPGQLHPAADDDEHEYEKQDPAHRRKGTRSAQVARGVECRGQWTPGWPVEVSRQNRYVTEMT